MKLTKHLLLTVAMAGALGLNAAPPIAKDSPALDLARQLNSAFIEVADKVSPAVVVIKVAHKPSMLQLDDEENPLWEMIPREFRKQLEEQRDKQREKQQRRGGKPGASREPIFDGQGSGVVIREDGYILTNNHVVEGADKIKVRLKDGKYYDAVIRGTDAQSDIAVLKIEAKGLPTAKLADSAATRVGEFAIAIGAPFDLDYSVTIGHVSAKGRSQIIPSTGGSSSGASMDQDFIQTDASINPGNSGGPLVNLYSEVIGINTLIRGMHTGIGFAVPSNLAREVADKLISDGKFTRAWLGVGIRALKDDEDYLGLVKGISDGVIVTLLQPDGPASKSDLRPGDVITTVDGVAVGTAVQLKGEIRGKKIGAPVTLDVYRLEKNQTGKMIKVKVKPEAWPDDTIAVVNKGSGSGPVEKDSRGFGVTVKSVTKELAERFSVEVTPGVIVTEVEPDSAAERKGIKPGDIITEVNQKAVTTSKQFKDALKDADPKKGIIVNLISKGVSKFEVLKETGE